MPWPYDLAHCVLATTVRKAVCNTTCKWYLKVQNTWLRVEYNINHNNNKKKKSWKKKNWKKIHFVILLEGAKKKNFKGTYYDSRVLRLLSMAEINSFRFVGLLGNSSVIFFFLTLVVIVLTSTCCFPQYNFQRDLHTCLPTKYTHVHSSHNGEICNEKFQMLHES